MSDDIVLIAEDSPSSGKMLTYLFRELVDAQILLTCDGQEALEAYIDHKKEVQIAFIDLNMPRMNGFDLCREIKRLQSSSRFTGPKCKLIALTGDQITPHIEDECLDSGFQCVIEKPVTKELLLKLIERHSDLPLLN